MADDQYKKKRRRLPKHRLDALPKFELKDISGDFDIDANGNSILVRNKDGKLYDKLGRRVNRRGYLIDV